jgi:transposase
LSSASGLPPTDWSTPKLVPRPHWAFCQLLHAAGKLPDVALTACIYKLLTILNAMLKHRRRWDPTLAQTS